MDEQLYCHRCGQVIVREPGSISVGYGLMKGQKYCYPCCGRIDSEHMRDHDKTVLYLTKSTKNDLYKIINWPGSLALHVRGWWTGKHNWSGKVIYVQFKDEWGNWWSGRNYPKASELLYCKKMKGAPK